MNFFVQTHVVQQGETMDDIIQKYKIPSVEILRYFHNQNVVSRDNLVGNKVFKGQEIFIPTPQDIDKIEIEHKKNQAEKLVQEENILQNSFLRFPYHKGEHFYNISIKTMVQTSTLQCRVRHLYASNNIFTIEISQNNHNSLDNQMIFLGEEINTYIFPLTISVNKEGEVIEVGDFQSILQRWNSKKEKINQLFQGKIIQNIINKTEDILLSSKTISHNLNTNILWAFLLRGVTGKYENGECRKKLSVNLGSRKFEIVNKMSFSENLQATTYKVLQDIFEKRKKLKAPELKDLVQVYQEEKISKEKELPSDEKFWESYQEFKSNRDAVHEFEVELNLNQIEKVVDDGIYVKVKFGIRQEGLIFVPNMELDMEEDKVKVFIRETSSYYQIIHYCNLFFLVVAPTCPFWAEKVQVMI